MFKCANNIFKFLLCAFVFSAVCIKKAAADMTVVDFNGKVLGQVISSGMVINADGENVGYITADSLVVNDEGQILGGILPQGIVIGYDNRLLGKIHGDGIVRSFAGKDLGRGLPNGLVINNKDEIIGAILFPSIIYSDEGMVVGRMTGAGTYTDMDGQELGFVSAGGYAYRKTGDSYVIDGRLISSKMVVANDGKFLGSIAPSGEVVDFEAKKVGNIHANGYVYDEGGKIIGRVVSSEYVFDAKGKYLGIVSYNGTVINTSGEEIGHYRSDGNVVNENGKIIGYTLSTSAGISDLKGKYIGRVVPDGNVIRGAEVLGKIGAKNYVYNENGELIGQAVKTGPVFDVSGNLKGEGMNNGALVAVNGNVIGHTLNNFAFDTNGLMIGGISKDMVAVNAYNKSLGVVETSGTVGLQSEKNIVSPFGYLFNAEKKVIGSGFSMAPVYSLEGNLYSDMNPNGVLYRSADNVTVTPNGMAVGKDGFVGCKIDFNFAYNQQGENLGYLMNNNTIMNTDGQTAYKITPKNYVVTTLGQSENNVMPLSGYAGKIMVAISTSGDLLGYTNNAGKVVDLNGNARGRVVYGNYVVDNSSAVVGKVVPFGSVQNDKCDVVGVMNGHADVVSSRDIIVGRVLPNGQSISDVGSYLGYGIQESGLIDFNGSFSGVVSNGSGLDYIGNNIGCVNREGIIKDDANKWRYGVIIQDSVIDFDGNIIGQIQADGSAVSDKNAIIGYMQPNGNVVSKSKKPLGNVMRYKVAFDEQNQFLGLVKNSGAVINDAGENVGQVMFDGSVVHQNEVVGYAMYDFYAYDENFITYGYFTKDGTVLSSVGSKLGSLEHGFVVDRDGKQVARCNRDYTIRDVSNNAIGELGFDGNVIDYENQNVGYITDDGAVKNAGGDIIAQAYPLQYYRGRAEKVQQTDESWADNKKVGIQDERQGTSTGEKQKDTSVSKDLSKKIIGIALSPDGDIIGDIYEDNTVRDANGVQKGFRTSDGIIMDMDYNPIGIEEIKRTSADNMFVPAGAFGNGNAYGIGSQPTNLGPGGGYGQGERYDPNRARALSEMQQMRRQNISVKPISSNFEVSNFTGYEEDGWPGIDKNISTWRVDMSQMILEDKPIPAVLARSVYASDGFGQNVPVTAVVERNIYAEDGRNIIIPAGSRAIGEIGGDATGGTSGGAVKVGISWRRIIRPDGAQFLLSSAQTADAQGRAGALAYLDQQLLKKYTSPLMMTVLESAVTYTMAATEPDQGTTTSSSGTTAQTDKSQAAQQARTQFLDQMQVMFDEIIRDKANIKSVTYVPAGTRIIIFPNQDLWLNSEKRNQERKDMEVESNETGLTNENTDARAGTVSTGSAGGGAQMNYDEEYEEEVAPASLTSSDTNANARRRKQTAVPAATQQMAPQDSSVGAVPDLM